MRIMKVSGKVEGKCNGCRLHLEFSATSDVSIFQTCSHDGNTRREPEPFVTVT